MIVQGFFLSKIASCSDLMHLYVASMVREQSPLKSVFHGSSLTSGTSPCSQGKQNSDLYFFKQEHAGRDTAIVSAVSRRGVTNFLSCLYKNTF